MTTDSESKKDYLTGLQHAGFSDKELLLHVKTDMKEATGASVKGTIVTVHFFMTDEDVDTNMTETYGASWRVSVEPKDLSTQFAMLLQEQFYDTSGFEGHFQVAGVTPDVAFKGWEQSWSSPAVFDRELRAQRDKAVKQAGVSDHAFNTLKHEHDTTVARLQRQVGDLTAALNTETAKAQRQLAHMTTSRDDWKAEAERRKDLLDERILDRDQWHDQCLATREKLSKVTEQYADSARAWDEERVRLVGAINRASAELLALKTPSQE